LESRSFEVRKSQDWVLNMFFEINSAATTITKLNEAFLSNADSSIPSRASSGAIVEGLRRGNKKGRGKMYIG